MELKEFNELIKQVNSQEKLSIPELTQADLLNLNKMNFNIPFLDQPDFLDKLHDSQENYMELNEQEKALAFNFLTALGEKSDIFKKYIPNVGPELSSPDQLDYDYFSAMLKKDIPGINLSDVSEENAKKIIAEFNSDHEKIYSMYNRPEYLIKYIEASRNDPQLVDLTTKFENFDINNPPSIKELADVFGYNVLIGQGSSKIDLSPYFEDYLAENHANLMPLYDSENKTIFFAKQSSITNSGLDINKNITDVEYNKETGVVESFKQCGKTFNGGEIEPSASVRSLLDLGKVKFIDPVVSKIDEDQDISDAKKQNKIADKTSENETGGRDAELTLKKMKDDNIRYQKLMDVYSQEYSKFNDKISRFQNEALDKISRAYDESRPISKMVQNPIHVIVPIFLLFDLGKYLQKALSEAIKYNYQMRLIAEPQHKSIMEMRDEVFNARELINDNIRLARNDSEIVHFAMENFTLLKEANKKGDDELKNEAIEKIVSNGLEKIDNFELIWKKDLLAAHVIHYDSDKLTDIVMPPEPDKNDPEFLVNGKIDEGLYMSEHYRWNNIRKEYYTLEKNSQIKRDILFSSKISDTIKIKEILQSMGNIFANMTKEQLGSLKDVMIGSFRINEHQKEFSRSITQVDQELSSTHRSSGLFKSMPNQDIKTRLKNGVSEIFTHTTDVFGLGDKNQAAKFCSVFNMIGKSRDDFSYISGNLSEFIQKVVDPISSIDKKPLDADMVKKPLDTSFVENGEEYAEPEDVGEPDKFEDIANKEKGITEEYTENEDFIQEIELENLLNQLSETAIQNDRNSERNNNMGKNR